MDDRLTARASITVEGRGTIGKLRQNHVLSFTHDTHLPGLPDTPDNYHTVTIEWIPEGPRANVALTQENNATPEGRDLSARS